MCCKLQNDLGELSSEGRSSVGDEYFRGIMSQQNVDEEFSNFGRTISTFRQSFRFGIVDNI